MGLYSMSRTRERADNRGKRPAYKKSEVTAAGVFRLVRKLKGSLKVGKKELKIQRRRNKETSGYKNLSWDCNTFLIAKKTLTLSHFTS